MIDRIVALIRFGYVTRPPGAVPLASPASCGSPTRISSAKMRSQSASTTSARPDTNATRRACLQVCAPQSQAFGFVERAEREVGIALAWRLGDGLGVAPGELLPAEAAPA